MTEPTQLDAAHAAMDADLSDDAARLRFYQTIADSELFVQLKTEATNDHIDPELVSVDSEDGAPSVEYILAFDREERLTAFAEGAAPYAALPGRIIAQMLSGSAIGIALNLGAPSSILIPNAALDWLSETLGGAPVQSSAMIQEIAPPAGLPEQLILGLEAKLTSAAGLCDHAWIVKTKFDDASTGWMIGFVGAPDHAEHALARATQEALIFSGTDLDAMDVAFFDKTDPMVARLAKVGLRHDIPQPQEDITPAPRKAPGRDPNKPPILH